LAFFRAISRFISKTVQGTARVRIEEEQELVCNLSNGTVSSELERLANPHFKVTSIVDAEYVINGTRQTHV